MMVPVMCFIGGIALGSVVSIITLALARSASTRDDFEKGDESK